jgi:hypothetical protein
LDKRYIFREIKKEEIPDMFELILERMRWMDEKGIRQWNVTKYDEVYPMGYYEEKRIRGEVFVLVEEITNQIVAAGVLRNEDERWQEKANAFYLHNFATKIGEAGVGKIYIAHAERYTKEQGKAYLRLDSAIDNEKLTKYYEEQGYLPVGTCIDGMYEGILREKKVI